MTGVRAFMHQHTAIARSRQLAAIPFELTVHQDILRSPGHLIRIGIGCAVKNGHAYG
jgi:hypothetical protein